MATYKSDAGAILEPGNQINRLSSFNHEGVKGWHWKLKLSSKLVL